MKIASYNIMSGGFKDYSFNADKPERINKIVAVVKEIDADAIGLIDTFRWDKTFSVQDLSTLFGYRYVTRTNLDDKRLSSEGGESIGLVFMSKKAWINDSVLRLANRNGIKIEYDQATIILAYLDDLKEEVRLKQAEALISLIDNPATTLVMGDLNTFSSADLPAVSENIKHFYANNPGMKDKLGSVLADMQEGKVIQFFEARGFEDMGIGKGFTVPTGLFPAVIKSPFLRVDYCLRGNGLKVSNLLVHSSTLTDSASDHLPISFELE